MKTLYYNNQKYKFNFSASFYDDDLDLFETYFFNDGNIVLKCLLNHFEVEQLKNK